MNAEQKLVEIVNIAKDRASLDTIVALIKGYIDLFIAILGVGGVGAVIGVVLVTFIFQLIIDNFSPVKVGRFSWALAFSIAILTLPYWGSFVLIPLMNMF